MAGTVKIGPFEFPQEQVSATLRRIGLKQVPSQVGDVLKKVAKSGGCTFHTNGTLEGYAVVSILFLGHMTHYFAVQPTEHTCYLTSLDDRFAVRM